MTDRNREGTTEFLRRIADGVHRDGIDEGGFSDATRAEIERDSKRLYAIADHLDALAEQLNCAAISLGAEPVPPTPGARD